MLERDRKFYDKNRYSDILAFKHSRVRLVERNGLVGDVAGYINANFVDGLHGGVDNRGIIAS